LIEADRGGPFHFLVGLIQHNAGVRGNAFPSAHIMLAFVVLVFTWRYLPRAGPWLLVLNLLMCLGAIYDGYHYASDTVVGALIGLLIGIAYARTTVTV
jgi:membrane-associated phospholipid phosphatase